MTHYFKLRTASLDIDITLRDKYVLILGESGKGKTTFSSLVYDLLNQNINAIESSLPVVVIRDKRSVASIGNEFVIYVCDEEVAPLIINKIQDKCSYCIAMTRKTFKSINMSHRCLYRMQRDNAGVSRLVPLYNYVTDIRFNRYDCIITEDSGLGYDIYKSRFKNTEVIPASSKYNLSRVLESLQGTSRVLIIADAGGLADCSKKLSRAVSDAESKGTIVDFCLPECLEHVLLCSEFLKFDKDVLSIFSTRFNNTESFCEKLLEMNTRNTPFHHAHSKRFKSDCWLIDCTKCPKLDCAYRVEGDKFTSLVKNGPISSILNVEGV